MSFELYGGPGPVPLSAASASWSAMAGQLTEASVVLGAAVAELAVGWRGPAADMALASFAHFGVWLGETIEHAGRMGGTTGAGAAAYIASAVVMPSPAEIAVTKAAMTATTVAAASTGAGLGAAMAANEAAEREMDIRATLSMEGYESASTLLSAPIPFRPAPPIAIPELQEAGLAVDLVSVAAAEISVTLTEFSGPIAGPALGQGAGMAVSVSTHAAGFDATGVAQPQSSAVATKQVLPAAISHSAASLGSGMTGLSGGGRSLGAASPAVATVSATRLGATRLGVPTAGALAGPGGAGASQGSGAAVAGEGTGGSGRMGAGPLRAAGGGLAVNADDDHDSPDYLRRLDRLEDGRAVVPAVIGAAVRRASSDCVDAGMD